MIRTSYGIRWGHLDYSMALDIRRTYLSVVPRELLDELLKFSQCRSQGILGRLLIVARYSTRFSPAERSIRAVWLHAQFVPDPYVVEVASYFRSIIDGWSAGDSHEPWRFALNRRLAGEISAILTECGAPSRTADWCRWLFGVPCPTIEWRGWLPTVGLVAVGVGIAYCTVAGLWN